VEAIGIGEVFAAQDAGDLARALKAVLSEPERYRKPYADSELLAEYTWEHQAETYDEIYRRLLPQPRTEAAAGLTLVPGVDPYRRGRALEPDCDDRGVHRYERGGRRYRHPVRQTQYAISLLQEYQATGEAEKL